MEPIHEEGQELLSILLGMALHAGDVMVHHGLEITRSNRLEATRPQGTHQPRKLLSHRPLVTDGVSAGRGGVNR